MRNIEGRRQRSGQPVGSEVKFSALPPSEPKAALSRASDRRPVLSDLHSKSRGDSGHRDRAPCRLEILLQVTHLPKPSVPVSLQPRKAPTRPCWVSRSSRLGELGGRENW